MGVVYEARDERLERTVAVKTMSRLANDDTARRRFWREARAAASVNHPNVCQIMDDPEAIFQEGWLLCDVGEYERGLEYLRRAVDRGYHVAPTLAGGPQFDALRRQPAFQAVLSDAEAGRHSALAAFRQAGGEQLLGAGMAKQAT
jgi:serine/threonine protein kinase